jgi:uncharacterized protein YndB with AHSA1/START domain
MKSLHFATIIQARREKVWETMLAPATYRQWTAEFAEGSYFEGSWAKGDRIRFLAPSGSGMTSVIAENRPHEFLSIKHLGIVNDGVEDTDSEAARSWAPSFENYSLADTGSATELQVDMDVTPEFEEYLTKTWPKALARLKAICESPAAGTK